MSGTQNYRLAGPHIEPRIPQEQEGLKWQRLCQDERAKDQPQGPPWGKGGEEEPGDSRDREGGEKCGNATSWKAKEAVSGRKVSSAVLEQKSNSGD